VGQRRDKRHKTWETKKRATPSKSKKRWASCAKMKSYPQGKFKKNKSEKEGTLSLLEDKGPREGHFVQKSLR